MRPDATNCPLWQVPVVQGYQRRDPIVEHGLEHVLVEVHARLAVTITQNAWGDQPGPIQIHPEMLDATLAHEFASTCFAEPAIMILKVCEAPYFSGSFGTEIST